MMDLRAGLLADGSSDRCLLRVLAWSLRQAWPTVRLATPVFERRTGRLDPEELEPFRARHNVALLFVHRDAERVSHDERLAEIPVDPFHRVIPVVPVRMTEAWLLISERAIRRASGNPNGTMRLDLPAPRDLEGVADPKGLLRDAIVRASGLTGPRRRQRFERDLPHRVQRVADEIEDFTPLRQLAAFREFEKRLNEALTALQGAAGRPSAPGD